jgi:hypothetical protein
MVNIILTKKQLKLISENYSNKSKQQLNENWIENTLMVAGFVPIIGELADIALICYYLYKGEKLYAALMLIALIPTVGDFIVKPIIKAFKGTKGSAAVMKGGESLAEYLAKNPEIAKKFSSLGKYVNEPAVQQTVQGITKVNSSLGARLKEGLRMLTGGGQAIKGMRAGGKEVIAGGSFKTGLKDYFKGERLSKYFARHGVLPETGIRRWWEGVLANRDRRTAFTKFITANNLLDYFGIPSLTTFEEKMANDAEFRDKVAQDPKTSEYIAQNYEQGDVPASMSTTPSKDEINNYIKQRGSGVGLSSILGRPSTTSALVSTATTSPKNDSILSVFSTIFGGTPKMA